VTVANTLIAASRCWPRWRDWSN